MRLKRRWKAGRRQRGLELFRQSGLSSFKDYVRTSGGDQQDDYVSRTVDFICSNYSDDISLPDASGELGITPAYLSRLFRQKTGYTFLEYLTCYRLRKALKLLNDSSLRINEIASMTGVQGSRLFFSIVP